MAYLTIFIANHIRRSGSHAPMRALRICDVIMLPCSFIRVFVLLQSDLLVVMYYCVFRIDMERPVQLFSLYFL